MSPELQAYLFLGAVVLLLIIFLFLKRGLMSVKYSLLWLFLAVILVVVAAFPYLIFVLDDLMNVEMPVHQIFFLMFCFVLVVLLSLSIAISQLADKCRRLTQSCALLEERLRRLESPPDGFAPAEKDETASGKS